MNQDNGIKKLIITAEEERIFLSLNNQVPISKVLIIVFHPNSGTDK
jgi:hypothetical protein